MMKNKILVRVLSVLTATCVLTGCTSEVPSTHGAKRSHLTILGTEGWSPCSNWNEVGEYSAFQTLEKMLSDANLEIDWEVIPRDKYPMLLQTRLASRKNLPDIAKANTLDDSTLLNLAERGIILPINEIVEQYSAGPAKEALAHDFPTFAPLSTAEDGNIYWFTNVQNKVYQDNTNANGSFTIQYRKDWADKLGIPEPTNLQEFTQMLRAFRQQDANGNGKADEILFINPSTFRTAIAQWFGLGTATIAVDPETNQIISPWKQPHVGEYFAYLNQLVQEGILDADKLTSYDMKLQLCAEDRIGAVWDYPDAMWNDAAARTVNPHAEYVPLMPLPAVEGIVPASMSEPGALVWERFVVTRDCKDLEAVGRLLDLIFSEEYKTLTSYGQEGINYTIEDGKIIPIPGLDFNVLKENRIAEGAILWNGVLPRVQEVDMEVCNPQCDANKRDVTLNLINYPKQYPDQTNNFLALPTREEAARINELQQNLEIASKELALKLTLGLIPLTDLEKEVEKLDQLGLAELMEISQKRYDRYLAQMPSDANAG